MYLTFITRYFDKNHLSSIFLSVRNVLPSVAMYHAFVPQTKICLVHHHHHRSGGTALRHMRSPQSSSNPFCLQQPTSPPARSFPIRLFYSPPFSSMSLGAGSLPSVFLLAFNTKQFLEFRHSFIRSTYPSRRRSTSLTMFPMADFLHTSSVILCRQQVLMIDVDIVL